MPSCGKAKAAHDELYKVLKAALPSSEEYLSMDKANAIMAKAWVTITEAKLVAALTDATMGVKLKREAVEKILAMAVKSEKKLTHTIRSSMHKAIMKESNQAMLDA